MNKNFQFSELLGFDPPFEFNDSDTNRVGFYEEQINFDKLVKAIKSVKPDLLIDFDYSIYKSRQKTTVEVKDRETEEIYTATYVIDVPFSYLDENGNKRRLKLYGRLNRKRSNVQTQGAISRVKIEVKKRWITYSILFLYEGFDEWRNRSDKSDINRVAIDIRAISFSDYKAAYTYLGFKNSKVENLVLEEFNKALDKAREHPSDLAFLYNQAPEYVLHSQEENTLWQDLKMLLQGFVINSKEKALLRALRVLATYQLTYNKDDKEAKEKFRSRANAFFKTVIFIKLFPSSV